MEIMDLEKPQFFKPFICAQVADRLKALTDNLWSQPTEIFLTLMAMIRAEASHYQSPKKKLKLYQ